MKMIGITDALQAEATVADESSRRIIMDEGSFINNNNNKTEEDYEAPPPRTFPHHVTLIPIAEDFLLMDEDKDVIVDPAATTTTTTTNRVSFIRRLTRPNNLKLAAVPSNSRSVTPSENSVDDTDTSSDQVDGKRRKSRISKPLDVGFRNLSYSVKTGIFRRGKWNLWEFVILWGSNGQFLLLSK